MTVTSEHSVAPGDDLFSQPQGLSTPTPALILTPPVHPVRATRTVRPAKIWLAAFAGIGLAILFKFPFVALVATPLAGVSVVLLAERWRRSGSVVITLSASAFLAQVTSIFVTPFTWALRFGFFAALLGTLVFFLPSPARDL